MSTRANVIVREGLSSKVFYCHCDGYPSRLGMDLRESLTKACRERALLSLSVVSDYVYLEETDDVHGDIDYLYDIDIVSPNEMHMRIYNIDSVAKTLRKPSEFVTANTHPVFLFDQIETATIKPEDSYAFRATGRDLYKDLATLQKKVNETCDLLNDIIKRLNNEQN